MRKLEQIITIGLLAGVGLIAAKNWGSLKTISSNVNTTISGALTTIANKTVKDASKE